jgi:hypothetical protein
MFQGHGVERRTHANLNGQFRPLLPLVGRKDLEMKRAKQRTRTEYGVDHVNIDEQYTCFMIELKALEEAANSINYTGPVERAILAAFAELSTASFGRPVRSDIPVFIGDFFATPTPAFVVGVPESLPPKAKALTKKHLEAVPGFMSMASGRPDQWPIVPWFRYQDGSVFRYGGTKRSWLDAATGLKVVRRTCKVVKGAGGHA